MNSTKSLPIAIIGAGPVGLAAAAHLVERGEPFVLVEQGAEAGASIRQWGHVRLFSPWRYCIDGASERLLLQAGWQRPDLDALPTGSELIHQYLNPLAAHPAIAPNMLLGARVVSVTRRGMDKTKTAGRETQPFVLRLADGRSLTARAVIDATGTWSQPNPMGADGRPATGEQENASRISYGIPDISDAGAASFAGKRTLVVGSGHSAINSVLALLDLKRKAAGTSVIWALRRTRVETVYGGEAADALPARGALGSRARQAVEAGELQVLAPFSISKVAHDGNVFTVGGELGEAAVTIEVDRIVVATGFRPDLDMLRELRLAIDPTVESSLALGPLIDPNIHSCGTVPPHGARELAHPEADFFVIGAKSYGRAPTFLMATGYEQARSVAAYLVGDFEAASRVDLVLPETGVCSSDGTDDACCSPSRSFVSLGDLDVLPLSAGTSAYHGHADGLLCCGGPAPAGTGACCVLDAEAKAGGEAGCGCADSTPGGGSLRGNSVAATG